VAQTAHRETNEALEEIFLKYSGRERSRRSLRIDWTAVNSLDTSTAALGGKTSRQPCIQRVKGPDYAQQHVTANNWLFSRQLR
jgi:hypothetical protein